MTVAYGVRDFQILGGPSHLEFMKRVATANIVDEPSVSTSRETIGPE
jgi:hypothetical protein